MQFKCHVCGNNVFNLYWHLRAVHRWPRLKSELKATKGLNQRVDKEKCHKNYQWGESITKYLMGNTDVDMSKDVFHLARAKLRDCGNPEKYLVLEPLLKQFCRELSDELDCITTFIQQQGN